MKYFVVLFLILFASCKSEYPSRKIAALTAEEKLENSVDSLFHSKIKNSGPGAAVLIAYNNEKLVTKGFGMRDLETEEPITPSTNFRIGSVSKQFTEFPVG